MPLKINLIYNQHQSGWTETFYAPGSDPVAALNTLTNPFFNKAVAFRAAGTVLYALRASVVGGNRASFLRIVNVPAPGPDEFDPTPTYAAPDVVSTDAVYSLNGLTGKKRAIALRGLRDGDVIRNTNGNFAPSAALVSLVNAYFLAVFNLGWTIRFEVRPPDGGLSWLRVVSVTKVNLNDALSILEVPSAPFVITQPTAVTIQGVPKDDLPGLPRNAVAVVTSAGPDQVVIQYRYRGHAAITYPIRMRLTPTVYGYEPIVNWVFVRFSERKTGKPFGSLRGRARVAIRQL